MRNAPFFGIAVFSGSAWAFLATGAFRTTKNLRHRSKHGEVHRSFRNEDSRNGGHAQDDSGIVDTNIVRRRDFFIKGIIYSSAAKSIAARAQTSLPLTPKTEKTATSFAICDPTVESYRKGSNAINVVGTAHISTISAQLSKEAVREAEPDAVFLELDLQRLSRAFRGGKIDRPVTLLFLTGENRDGGGRVALQSAVLASQNLERRPTGIARLFDKLVRKNPIQGMYDALETQGITPREEFITAVEEGVNGGSIIILGDRRMDITLRRLANALVFHTDPKQLIEADQRITAKLKARMPELAQLEKELKQQKRDLSTQELASFVERLKTKETTMDIMTEIRRAAPELHQALHGCCVFVFVVGGAASAINITSARFVTNDGIRVGASGGRW